jgi:hypothetical protein
MGGGGGGEGHEIHLRIRFCSLLVDVSCTGYLRAPFDEIQRARAPPGRTTRGLLTRRVSYMVIMFALSNVCRHVYGPAMHGVANLRCCSLLFDVNCMRYLRAPFDEIQRALAPLL